MLASPHTLLRYGGNLLLITYSVLRLPARRTDPWTEIPIAGIRAGERKTC